MEGGQRRLTRAQKGCLSSPILSLLSFSTSPFFRGVPGAVLLVSPLILRWGAGSTLEGREVGPLVVWGLRGVVLPLKEGGHSGLAERTGAGELRGLRAPRLELRRRDSWYRSPFAVDGIEDSGYFANCDLV